MADQGAERFELVKKLQDGRVGVANLMRIKATGELVTVKFIPRGPKVDESVEREIMCHRELSHPNIIRLLEVFLTPEHLGIVMEHASDGELFDYVAAQGSMPEAEARYFFQQLICGVEYCHKMGVVHRDLKLENTHLHIEGDHAPRIKICDFGYSKSMRYHSLPNSTVGTPAYIAPEVFTVVPGQSAYSGEPADVWSCGVLLYVLLFGCYPFGDPKDPNTPITEVINRITRAKYQTPPDASLSAEVRDLFSKIFVVNPMERISVSGIRSHPFFTTDLPWEFQVNAPLPPVVRQTDDETRAIIAAAREPDMTMSMPFWANDIVPMIMDINPAPLDAMDHSALGSGDWNLDPDDIQEMMSLIELGAQGGPQGMPSGMHSGPQGLGGLGLPGARSAASGHGSPQPPPPSGFNPLGMGSSHSGSSAMPPVGINMPPMQAHSSSPAGLGMGLGLGPKPQQGRR